MSQKLARENAYVCEACGFITVTVDVDVGVTPFMIGCTREGCAGWAKSSFYPKAHRPPEYPEPTHEWYQPGEKEMRRLRPAEREHVDKGGLLMRPRTDAPPVFHGEEEAVRPPRIESPTRHAMRAVNKTGRNEPCPCGSGQKYKRCCISKQKTT